MSRALIFANGEFSRPELIRSLVQPGDVIIAADGGSRHALALGLTPALIIGDLDSLSASEVRNFEDMGVQFQRVPRAKDETDLELALTHALHAGYSPVIITTAYGGRLDQSLGNINMLASPEALRSQVRLDDGLTEAFFVTGQAEIHGAPGETVSFIPWSGPVQGVSTTGLVYPLHAETLYPFRTRSLSNEMLTGSAGVSLTDGLLLCIHIRKI